MIEGSSTSKHRRDSKWRILVIDDDEDDYLIVREMLKDARGRRFDVRWVSSYESGRQELFAHPYDAALVDYDLGAQSGIELIGEVTRRGSPVPLILFTGRGSYEVDVQAMQAGATMYLSKGEANGLLLERSIRYAVELKQKETELAQAQARLEQELAEKERNRQELLANAAAMQRVEAALRTSQEQLADFLDKAQEGFFSLDQDWTFVHANRRLGEILSVDSAALLGKNFWKEWPLLKGGPLEREYRQAMEARLPAQLQVQGIHRPEQWYDLSIYPTAHGISAFLIDRTAEKNARAELETAYARLRFFVDSNLIGVAVGAPDGTLIEVNDYFLNLTGYTRADFQAGQVNWRRLTPPEYLPLDERALGELQAAGASEPYEKELYCKDGSRVWVYISSTRLPDGDAAGCVLDISQRKRAERDLRRLVEGNIIGINVRDEYGQLLDANQAFLDMIGYTQEDLAAGRLKIPELTPPSSLPLDRAAVREVLATGSCKPYEKEYIHKDGHTIPAMVGYTRLDDAEERFIGYVLDLTQLKRAQAALQEYTEKLQRSNQELEQFALVASHDLQEPLRKVKTFGQVLQQKLAGQVEPAAQEDLQRMLAGVERMQKMIQDLLELARVNTRPEPYVEVDLGRVAAEVISNLEGQIRRTGGEVIVGPLPVIQADPGQMFRLLQNLTANGLKFHRPGTRPRVKISGEIAAGSRGRQAVLRVEDNGIGFDEQRLEDILRPFGRLHGRSEYEGTGIGLAIVKKIVDRHHGEIRARSTPGEGATFVITLPARQAGPEL